MMMLQTMIVKNGLIRINDQYPRNPRQTIRIAKSKSSSFDALSFGDRSSSCIAGASFNSRSERSRHAQDSEQSDRGLSPIDRGSLLSAGTAEQIIERAKSVGAADLLADAFGSQQVAYASTRPDDAQLHTAGRKVILKLMQHVRTREIDVG